MTNLITIADFAGIVAFSTNISALTSEPYIRKAQERDVWPLLTVELRTELLSPRDGWAAATETLFIEKIKPLLVCEAARRMMLWHGTHVTQAGLEEQVQDASRLPASSTRRAVLSGDLQADCAYYRALLLAALPTPAGRCSTPSTRRPGRGGSSFTAL